MRGGSTECSEFRLKRSDSGMRLNESSVEMLAVRFGMLASLLKIGDFDLGANLGLLAIVKVGLRELWEKRLRETT